MPSFTRRLPPSNPPPPGTSPSPIHSALPLLPTGLPSLDDLLGGGLPLSNLLLVLSPDTQSAWGRLVERYWIAQGLVSGQEGVVVGEEGEGRAVVKGCMWVERGATAPGDGSESEGEGGVGGGERKIAWRYEKMGKYKTTVGGSGPQLSLMTPLPSETLDAIHTSRQMTYIPLDPPLASSSTSSPAASVLDAALKGVYDRIAAAKKGQAVRVTVHELGSLDWGEVSLAEVHRFIHSLRAIIASKPAAVLLTIPASFIDRLGSSMRESAVKELAWAVDACVELKGFADDPTLPPLFPTTHGLLTLHSFPTSHALLPSTLKHSTLLGVSQTSSAAPGGGGGGGAGENNLGFKLRRKRFVVETVHLGVEGGVGERRTGGDVGEALEGVKSVVSSSTGILGGVERAQSQAQPAAAASASLAAGTEVPPEADTRPRGADKDKKASKPRARVRFGGEEEVVVVGRAGDAEAAGERHSHGHDHHEHGHGHDHSHGEAAKKHGGAPRVALRHDRPDLYEF
ncbi:hypothetical protein IAT38_000754 [Cryptococcus sp. DSM 104549]